MLSDYLAELTDNELRARLKGLARDERLVGIELLRHLAEYDQRLLFIADGYGNLWQYCLHVLGFSETEIGLRIHAARAIRDNPELALSLERGETTISAIGRLAPHLKGENRLALIEEAKGKTRRKVEQIVARESVSARVVERRLSESQSAAVSPTLFEAARPKPAAVPPPTLEECSEWVRRENPDRIVPVSGSDFKIELVAAASVVKDLEEVRALLARRFPEARLEDVVGACLQMVLAKLRPRSRPSSERTPRGLIGPRRPAIPALLRAAVLERDGHRCTFEGAEGRCLSGRRLELDHILPKARGGADSLENLRAMCPTHNRFLAKLAFGATFIETAIARRRAARVACG